ncbi:N-acetylmannosaminyltransferase [Prosthecochloris sp. ZM]|nr:N-acetylmannosaminyltransferase [Prosthecochloris sp. ZM]
MSNAIRIDSNSQLLISEAVQSRIASITAVILGSGKRLNQIRSMLEKANFNVILLEKEQELERLSRALNPVQLIILADSYETAPSKELLLDIRRKLCSAHIICLSETLDEELERGLRSAGLIFFGSHTTFLAYAEKIINHTLKSIEYKNMDSRQKRAQKLEKRLARRSFSLKSTLKRASLRITAFMGEGVVRCIEICTALAVTVLFFFPVLLWLFMRKLINAMPVFSSRDIQGTSSETITVQQFNVNNKRVCEIPLYLELFSGRLALVGTAIKEPDNNRTAVEQAYITMFKPGIVSLWDIRKAGRIAHEGQVATEWEYIFKKHPLYDLLLLLRAIPTLLYTQNDTDAPPILHLLGLDINNITMDQALSIIKKHLSTREQCRVFFVNPDCLNKMISDSDYYTLLQQGEYVFPDGIGLTLAGKILGTPLKENINGTDMLPYLCSMAADEGHSVFLLGGKPGIAEKAAASISMSSGVTIAGSAHGYFNHQTESHEIVETINRSGASILLVAFGAPLQEKWITQYRSQLKPHVLMGVGGLFDFYSGTIRRAPRWMREIGMEWVYRILQEPKRMWKRYVIGNPLFLYRIIKWKLFTGSSKS